MLIDYFSARMPALDITQAALMPAAGRSVFSNNGVLTLAPDESTFVDFETVTIANQTAAENMGLGRSLLYAAGIVLPSANPLARVNPRQENRKFRRFEID